MRNEIVLRPSYWASVSGGKDSLYMLNLILNNLDKYQLDGVVHFELEIDYPFIKDVIDFMEERCRSVGIRFVRIKPTQTWSELYDKWGFPTRKARWCNSSYKLNAKKQLSEFLKSQGCKLVSYIGYCADETKRYIGRQDKNEIYPLVDFNINESSILEWAKQTSLFNDYYKINQRCGCMYCPMSSMTNLAYLYIKYPENFEYMMSLAEQTEQQREIELGRKFSVFSSNPKYNVQYYRYRVVSHYVPKVMEVLND